MTKIEYFTSKMGEAVAVICARGYYRGIVRSVSENGLLLSNPSMIFEESSYTTVQPKEEYPIPSDLWISLDAVEMACQPTWAFYGFDKLSKKGE